MTDTDLTLKYLREAGSRGMHSFDLNRLVGTTRIAARIGDLKKLGHNITSITERRGDSIGCRYFIHEQSQTVQMNNRPKRTVADYDRMIQEKREAWLRADKEHKATIELQARILIEAKKSLMAQEAV